MQDGHPPLGWNDTAAYLVLPVLLVVSQFVSMELMKPPQVNICVFIDIGFSIFIFVLCSFCYETNIWLQEVGDSNMGPSDARLSLLSGL